MLRVPKELRGTGEGLPTTGSLSSPIKVGKWKIKKK
jgi:hypothetical protein